MVLKPSIHLRVILAEGDAQWERLLSFSVVWRQTVSPVIIRVPQYLNFWASRHQCICHAQHSWATWLDADRSVNRLARLQADGWLVDIFQALAVTYILYTDKNSAFKFTSFDPPDFAVIAKVGNDFLEPRNTLTIPSAWFQSQTETSLVNTVTIHYDDL